MKIAICVSGAPRNIKRALQSISFIQSTGDVKVFIHTWAESENKKNIEKVSTKNKWPEHEKNTHQDVIDNFSYEKIQLDWFESTSITIENYKNKHTIQLNQYPKALSPYCMFYSFQQVEKLKSEYEAENDIIFDIVYRMRFDSAIKNPEVLPCSPFDREVLVIPAGSDWGGINDQFAYGTSLTMKNYFNLYQKLPYFSQKTFHNPEQLLKHYLHTHNFPLERSNLIVHIHDR